MPVSTHMQGHWLVMYAITLNTTGIYGYMDTCVTQGTEDEVIHISCAQRLAELCKASRNVMTLWAPGFDHQNLESCAQ